MDNLDYTAQHAKNLSKDSFNNLCRDIPIALAFYKHRFLIQSKNSRFLVSDKCMQWCYDNCSDLYYADSLQERRFSIYFLSEEDATHFKLVWCDNKD